MKKYFMLIVCLLASLALVYLVCFGSFGHETYTDTDDYSKIFELTEIRYTGGFQLFPRDITELDVKDFYCEWDLGIVGSATAEIHLAVTYGQDAFEDEVSRLRSIGNGETVYDTEHFYCPAYVAAMGYYGTNWYALTDEDTLTVHYVLLQIIDEMRIDIGKDLIPDGYYRAGDVADVSFCIYE